MVFEHPLLKLVLSMILGGFIGWERFVDHKPAGLRTHTLVCLGSTAFLVATQRALGGPGADPSSVTRVMQGVITGIGFLGAGSIIQSAGSVHGLTTAATIWIVAGIGTLVGMGEAGPAAVLTVMTLVVLRGFKRLEIAWRRRHPRRPGEPGTPYEADDAD